MGVIEELEDNDAGCCPTVKKVAQKEMSWDHPKFTNLKVKLRLKIGEIQIFMHQQNSLARARIHAFLHFRSVSQKSLENILPLLKI